MTFISSLNELLWSVPLAGLLMGLHIFFTFYLKIPQLHIVKALLLPFSKAGNNTKNTGGLSLYQGLATMLAATLGTGNIIGVSTAIALGGPGALFWCILTGIFGMATAYAESFLSVLHRIKDKKGEFHGGPMYVMRNHLKKPLLGTIFCICALPVSFFIGSAAQAAAIADSCTDLWHFPRVFTSVIITIMAGTILLGGIKSIGKSCAFLIPILSIVYLLCCSILLWQNRSFLIQSVQLILISAFHPQSILGGLLPSGFLMAVRFGVARGLFTNEAGLGTTPIAACSPTNATPITQGLISMSAVFWDTIVFCSLTGLLIVSNMLKNPDSIIGKSTEDLTLSAFSFLPYQGESLLLITIIMFAFTTLIGWSYYGEQVTYYLFGPKSKLLYRLLYLSAIPLGVLLPLDAVLELTDFFNALMIFPNIILLCCSYRIILPIEQNSKNFASHSVQPTVSFSTCRSGNGKTK